MTTDEQTIAVLEVGGSHVTGAWVELRSEDPVGKSARLPLDSAGSADAIIDTLAEVGSKLEAAADSRWAIAFPGPFDYVAGIGRFSGVEKFDALRGFDVRHALAGRLGVPAAALHFVNDADAFALGVWASGSGVGRLVCLTLGTGIGSAFVADGVTVQDGDSVPPDGEIHLTDYHGKPIEETVSHRAIVRGYAAATGVSLPGVREVVGRARSGDPAAREVLRTAFGSLGEAVAPWLDRFGATDLVFGGSMAAAWPDLEGYFLAGLSSVLVSALPRIAIAADGERAAVIGAAYSLAQEGVPADPALEAGTAS